MMKPLHNSSSYGARTLAGLLAAGALATGCAAEQRVNDVPLGAPAPGPGPAPGAVQMPSPTTDNDTSMATEGDAGGIATPPPANPAPAPTPGDGELPGEPIEDAPDPTPPLPEDPTDPVPEPDPDPGTQPDPGQPVDPDPIDVTPPSGDCGLAVRAFVRDSAGECKVCSFGDYITLVAAVDNSCAQSLAYRSERTCLVSEFQVQNLVHGSTSAYPMTCGIGIEETDVVGGDSLTQTRPAGRLSAGNYELRVQFEDAERSLSVVRFSVE